jgi:predicted Zn-dependent peptidase
MIHDYTSLGEKVFRTVLPNGLTVAVVPRPGFSKKLAYFVTDFGSIHTDFLLEDAEFHVPAGIAHFLEHKMFELPDRDVSAEFASFGGNVNAFTSYDMTAYYVSCTEHFRENLRLLLEFVSTPYFPEESVQREMGIIDQEIGMNADAPDSRIFEQLTEIMYRKHPLRVPILGTSESIRRITPETLHACHQAFYTPGNMILCVIGDVDPEEVVRLAREVLGDEQRPVGEKLRDWGETPACAGQVACQMEVAMPTFLLGFKSEATGTGAQAIWQEIIGDLACEALFGESSALYRKLYNEGLIDGSSGGGFETVDGGALITCGGDSEDPEAVRAAILERARELVKEGIPEEDFLRLKRSAMGRRVRDLDSFDSTCFRLCAYHFSDFDYFRFPGIYADITSGEVLAFLDKTVTPQRCALSVIDPL